jgi:hypothetical protein
MKKILLIAALVVAGVVLYGKFQQEPNVRLENVLRSRWFSRAANNTGMATAVERFEVDKALHVKVYLTEDYQGLPGTQAECLRSIVAVVRNETLNGPKATVDFLYRGRVIAKNYDGSRDVKMEK